MTEAARSRLTVAAPYLGILGLNIAYRLPVFMNARGVNSDAAIVALQAEHILRGEFSRFLWGADYQGSIDAWIVAAFFAVFGATALTLMVVPFVGHLVMSFAVFAGLKRIVGALPAFISCLAIVFTPQAINGVVTYVPRQWGITLAIGGAVIIAWPGSRFAPLRIAVGLVVSLLSLYSDMFCVQWMPAVGFLALLACFDLPRGLKPVGQRLAGLAAGLLIGVGTVWWLRQVGEPKAHGFDISMDRIPNNWKLMSETCLPYLLGAKIYVPGSGLYPDLWHAPALFGAAQVVGAVSIFVLALVSTALAFAPRVPWPAKRAALFGAGAAGTVLTAFLVSGWPSDMWSTRYLAPIIWGLPFTLAPLAVLLRPRGLAVLLAPYLLVAAVAGWMSYGPYIDGVLPRIDARGAAEEEEQVGKFLRENGYKYAFSQYWLSYRMTFLWHEDPIVVPFEWNRYPPYREAASQQVKQAFIFHPSEPRATPQMLIPMLRGRPGRTSAAQVAGFTLLLYDGTVPKDPPAAQIPPGISAPQP